MWTSPLFAYLVSPRTNGQLAAVWGLPSTSPRSRRCR